MSTLPYKSHLYAHRKYDAGSSVYLPTIAARTPRWKPVGNQLATVKACTVPSIGDATAKWLQDDPIASPSLLNANYLHLTPQGNRLEQNLHVRYPRYVYVIGGEQLYTGIPGTGLIPALQAAYAPLAAIGCRLVFADSGTTSMASDQPHAIIVPINGGTSTPTGPFGTPDCRITSELDDYKAGELFVAVVQGSSSGLTFYKATGLIGDHATYANAVVRNTVDGPPAYPGYSVVESIVTGGLTTYLLVNVDLATYDQSLATVHASRYRKFRQKYYYPAVPIESFGGVPPFATTYASLLALVNPGAWPSASFPSMDSAAVASQIVADAVAYFTA